ncbi:MAG: clostripain-related cysteine peptidase [Elusimicrobia bacterium]|nr:clostripain-related cysteine peptidase [Elusimicrobiota bacterium]
MLKLAALLTALSGFVPPLSAALPSMSLPDGLPDFKLNSLNAAQISSSPAVSSYDPQAGKAKTENIKDWTIMVFMNGKSNIEPFALGDFNRFETVGSSDKVNIVVELGRSKGLENDTQADGDWDGVRRYLVVKDADKDHITSPVLMDLGRADMGDYKEVVSFVKWARGNYSSKRYMLIIWDHGWGWLDPKNFGANHVDDASTPSKSISHDFVTGNYIKTTDLGKIFKEAGKVDLYASMACFMQMAEVAYEIKDGADIIVGSEEVIQLPSFNFEDFFALMLKTPEASAYKAGLYLVDTFKEMYSRPEYADMLEKSKYGTQLSAIRPDKLAAFARKAKNWAALAMEVNDTGAYKKAKEGLLRFEVGDEVTDPDKQISFYGDLYNFVELVNISLNTSLPGAGKFRAAGEDLKKFITDELVIKNVYQGKDRTGKDYSNTHGISIDIPGKPGTLVEYNDTYGELAFEKAAGWQKFMKYLEALK